MAEALVGSREGRVDGRLVGDIALDGQDLDAVLLAQLRGARLETLDAAGEQNEVGALLGLAFGHLLAEARRGAADGHGLSGVVEHVYLLNSHWSPWAHESPVGLFGCYAHATMVEWT